MKVLGDVLWHAPESIGLALDAARSKADGLKLWRADNGVRLTDRVPAGDLRAWRWPGRPVAVLGWAIRRRH